MEVTQRPRWKKTCFSRWFTRLSRFQPQGFLLAVLGGVLCIFCRGSQQWQVWKVETIPGITRVTISLWKVCFYRQTPEGRYIETHCKALSQLEGSVPREILMARVLMTVAAVLQALAVCFISYPLWISKPNKSQRKVLFPLSNLGILLDIASGIILLIPLSWNMKSMWEKEGILFPESLQLPRVPKDRDIGTAMYLGFISLALELLGGVTIVIDKCRRSEEAPPLDSVIVEATPLGRESYKSPTRLGSLLNITNVEVEQRDFSDTSPRCSSPVHLPTLPLSSPTPNHLPSSPSWDSPLHLHLLTLSSSSPNPFPPFSRCGSSLCLSNLSVSSLASKDLPTSPSARSPLPLPTLRPSSPTQRVISTPWFHYLPTTLPPVDI